YLFHLRHRTKGSFAWDVVSTIGWIGIWVPYKEVDGLHWSVGAEFVMRSLMILMAYTGALQGVVWRAIVRNRWLTTIGGMCYTIYLFQKILASIALNRLTLHHVWSPTNFTVNLFMQ